MSYALTVRVALEAARITAPSFGDSVAGRLTRERADARLAAFGRRAVAIAGIRLAVTGVEKVPRDRVFVYMSNHQSHMDIPVLYATAPAPTLRMVAKAELFRIPLMGSAMRSAGFIEVDRSNRAQAIASLAGAAAQIRSGVSVWIAPEGTRSATAEPGALRKGGFHLALAAGVDIVPVAISGTHAVLPPDTLDMASGCPVKVVYGAPIAVTRGDDGGDRRDVDDLADEVAAFFRAHVDPSMRRAR